MAKRLRLRQPADLATAPLIHVSTFPLAWPVWLGGAGAGGRKAPSTIWLDTFGSALEAAEPGVGVALGLVPLFAAREKQGLVRRPFGFTHPTGSLWLLHPPAERTSPALRAFKRWLLAEIAADR